MKIINRANGRETTVSAAVSIVVDEPEALRELVTRLLEELTSTAAGERPSVLSAAQLSRVLAYGFRVED